MTVVEQRAVQTDIGQPAGRSLAARVWAFLAAHINLRGLAFACALLVLLEIITRWLITSIYVPEPSQVLAAEYTLTRDGDLLPALGVTVRTFALALVIAAAAGIVLGVLIGASTLLFNSLRLVIEFLRPLPSVALIPLATLVFGISAKTSVMIAAYAAFWPVLFNTYYGVRDANPVSIDSARTFGLSRFAILRRVLLPTAASNIAAGIRISAAITLILTITVEIITSDGGLGYLIMRMQTATRTADMYAGVFAVGVLGYIINLAVRAAERRAVFWKTSKYTGSS